jgi:hypothetical protein
VRRYEVVRKEPIVAFIIDAVTRSGGQVVTQPDLTHAPFELDVALPAGETIHLICYAFTANKYRQGGRPTDEHRFQVKYGSEFDAYHRLYLPRSRAEVTLFFGVHLEEGLFIACDPAMHEWTRFSRSVEFKTPDLREAQRASWHGWERERSHVRRKAPLPQEDCRTEILLAFTPERFLDYVALERRAQGIDPGERLLLIERWSEVASPTAIGVGPGKHALEHELGLPANGILDLIAGAFRLHVAVRGAAANHHLTARLRQSTALSSVTSMDKDGQPDLSLIYKGRPFLVECKNVLRKPATDLAPRVDFQKTRASKNDPCSRYYKPSQFQVLAACLHPLTVKWEYRFCATRDLAPHPRCAGRLSDRVVVTGDR